MTRLSNTWLRHWGLAAALALVALQAATPARADDASRAQRVPLLPKYQQECAACHLAYPPGMLPGASWQRLMSNLPRHFGTDASLDAATVNEIGQWLQEHAAGDRRSQRAAPSPPEDRITRSGWFLSEHREIGAAVWTRPSVKSPSNCAACHTRAEQGDFGEQHIRIPR